MKKYVFFTMMIIATLGVAQQSTNKIELLEAMVGEWEGSGWFMDRSRNRYEFNQREEVTKEVGGTALLIKGMGMIGDSVVHDAMAIIRYNVEKDDYAMFSILADGRETNTTMQILENSDIQWGLDVPGGKIRYTIQISEGVWTEKGAYSPDEENWYPFIGFTLKKL